MVGGFHDFLNQQDPENKKAGYQDYSQKIWGASASDGSMAVDAHTLINTHEPDSQNNSFSQAIPYLNKLNEKLARVKQGDEKTSKEAIVDLKKEFQPPTKVQRVDFSQQPDFIQYYADKAGVAPEDFKVNKLKFGAQDITSDAQYAKLEKDVELLKQYKPFEKAEVHLLDYGDKKIAVVVGVDASEFNTVLAAERKKQQLDQTVQMTLGGSKDEKKDQAVNTTAMTGKVGELQDKYPRTQQQADMAAAEQNLPKPQPNLPGAEKSRGQASGIT